MIIATTLSVKNYFWFLVLAITINVVGLLMAYIYAVYDAKTYRTKSAFFNGHPAAASAAAVAASAVYSDAPEPSLFGIYNPAQKIAQVVRSVMNFRSAGSSSSSSSSGDDNPDGSDKSDDFYDFRNATYRNTYVTINGPGRLGNKMFQYAALLAVSRHYGYRPFVPSNNVLTEVFKVRHDTLVDISNDDRFGEHKPGEFDTSLFEKLSADKNWTLTGYYQSWKYFTNITKIVKREFTFRDEILKEAFKVLKKFGLGKKTLIGVHIRRGDMLAQKLRGYNVADEHYVNKALNFYRKTVPSPAFLISSDDMNWSRNFIQESYDVNFVGGNSLGVDLAILANCQHSVITSGSYGWWAAWLAGGDTVYFSNYPRRNSWLSSVYNRNDYYPEWWIGME